MASDLQERADRLTPDQRDAMLYASAPGARPYRYIKKHFLNDLDLVRDGCGCCLSPLGKEVAALAAQGDVGSAPLSERTK